MAGWFVTFEGLDGSGKSTHLKQLAERLRLGGERVRVTREPGGTPLADAIRSVFLDPTLVIEDGMVEALLVFASRRSHLLEMIEPALTAGEHVLCDRFTDSSWAYQGYARGLDLEALERLDQLATGGRRPDRTLLFDIEPQLAQERSGRNDVDRLDARSVDFYSRVRAGFFEVARAEPGRFRLIDSSGSLEQTRTAVDRALADLFSLS